MLFCLEDAVEAILFFFSDEINLFVCGETYKLTKQIWAHHFKAAYILPVQ